jgi:hypothetical protein
MSWLPPYYAIHVNMYLDAIDKRNTVVTLNSAILEKASILLKIIRADPFKSQKVSRFRVVTGVVSELMVVDGEYDAIVFDSIEPGMDRPDFEAADSSIQLFKFNLEKGSNKFTLSGKIPRKCRYMLYILRPSDEEYNFVKKVKSDHPIKDEVEVGDILIVKEVTSSVIDSSLLCIFSGCTAPTLRNYLLTDALGHADFAIEIFG